MPLKDLEARRAYDRARYLRNRDTLMAAQRLYTETHRESISESKRIYYLANADSQREKSARYRRENPEKAAASRARSQRRRHDLHIASMNKIKATGCMDCGGPGEHFHHRDPSTKLFDIADGYLVTASALAAELAKCDVLCKLCHAARHRLLRLHA